MANENNELEKLKDIAFQQIDLLFDNGKDPYVVMEVKSPDEIIIKEIDNFREKRYDRYGDEIGEKFKYEYGSEYFCIGFGSKVEIRAEISNILENLSVLLKYRRKIEKAKDGIIRLITHKRRDCYVYILLSEKSANAGVLHYEPDVETLRELFKESFGDQNGWCSSEEISEFYKDYLGIPFDEEDYYGEVEPNERRIERFVADALYNCHRIINGSNEIIEKHIYLENLD